MRKQETVVRRLLVEKGLPDRLARRRVDWQDVRRRLDSGEPPDAIADNALRSILPFINPLDAVGPVFDLAGKLIDPLLPKAPPLPTGFQTDTELTNCTLVFVGEVAEGDYMKIEISNNGTVPLIDVTGEVEIITTPPIPLPAGQPGPPTIRGNGSVSITGPRTVFLHLKGEEDGCDVDITVFPRNPK